MTNESSPTANQEQGDHAGPDIISMEGQVPHSDFERVIDAEMASPSSTGSTTSAAPFGSMNDAVIELAPVDELASNPIPKARKQRSLFPEGPGPLTREQRLQSFQGWLLDLGGTSLKIAVSIFTSPLPFEIKQNHFFKPFSSRIGFFLSGILQALIVAVLLANYYHELRDTLIALPSSASLTKPIASTGPASLDILDFATRPWSLFLGTLLADIFVRTFEAAVSETWSGSYVLAWPYAAYQYLCGEMETKKLRDRLGPLRRDELWFPEHSLSGRLEYVSCRQKNWSEHPYLKIQGKVYLGEDCRIDARGDYDAYVYYFREIPHNHMIRGRVIAIDATGLNQPAIQWFPREEAPPSQQRAC